MNVKIVAVTMPGSASGRVTRRRTLRRVAPSIAAASSSSTGIVEKYAAMIQIEKARLNAALTRISARYVFTPTGGKMSPSETNSRKMPMTSAVGANIWVTRTSSRKASRPR